MKILNYIYNFIIDYSDLLKFCIIMFCFLYICLFVTKQFDIALTRDKEIIKNTKNYVIHDNCKYIDKKFYCWED